MSQVLFMGDMHLGHRGIHNKFRTEFSSDDEHNYTLYNNLKSVMTKRTKTFFMGDVAFDDKWLQRIKDLPGSKVLILGNHDTDKFGYHIRDLVNVYDDIYSLLKYKDFWLSHAPIHPDELRGKVNIHGHVHDQSILVGCTDELYNWDDPAHQQDDPRYINVCPEKWLWYPVSLQTVQSMIGK